jgi:cyanophycinase
VGGNRSKSRRAEPRLSLVSRRSPDHARRGAIVAIGGAEDKAGDRQILSEVVALAGGKGAVIAVLPTASQIPEQIAGTYRDIFRGMGAETRIVRIETRADAADPRNVELVRGATAIFFTGGAQGRIVSLIGGTPLAQAIRRAHGAGVVVAGTSAGASAVCQHMIAQGRAGYAPRRGSVTMAPGLGLTKRLVIDQHFAQRHRIGRLFAAVALNPFLIGVGIDEDTAAVLQPSGKMHVLGRGTVTVIDGSQLVHTDIHETPGASPAAVVGLRVHVLVAGLGFDVDAREPVVPGTRAIVAIAPPDFDPGEDTA